MDKKEDILSPRVHIPAPESAAVCSALARGKGVGGSVLNDHADESSTYQTDFFGLHPLPPTCERPRQGRS